MVGGASRSFVAFYEGGSPVVDFLQTGDDDDDV